MNFRENITEYESLRNEIIATQGARENAILYMYTVYIALFVLSIEYSHYILLVTFVVLIPFQARILKAEASIAKISAFIRLFFEQETIDMHWESLQETLAEHPQYVKDHNTIVDKLSGTGATQLGCLSTIFFLFKVLKEATYTQFPEYIALPDVIVILVSLVGVGFTVYITMKYKKGTYKAEERQIEQYKQELQNSPKQDRGNSKRK